MRACACSHAKRVSERVSGPCVWALCLGRPFPPSFTVSIVWPPPRPPTQHRDRLWVLIDLSPNRKSDTYVTNLKLEPRSGSGIKNKRFSVSSFISCCCFFIVVLLLCGGCRFHRFLFFCFFVFVRFLFFVFFLFVFLFVFFFFFCFFRPPSEWALPPSQSGSVCIF